MTSPPIHNEPRTSHFLSSNNTNTLLRPRSDRFSFSIDYCHLVRPGLKLTNSSIANPLVPCPYLGPSASALGSFRATSSRRQPAAECLKLHPRSPSLLNPRIRPVFSVLRVELTTWDSHTKAFTQLAVAMNNPAAAISSTAINIPQRRPVSPGPMHSDFIRQQVAKQSSNNYHSSSLKMITQSVNRTALHPGGVQYVAASCFVACLSISLTSTDRARVTLNSKKNCTKPPTLTTTALLLYVTRRANRHCPVANWLLRLPTPPLLPSTKTPSFTRPVLPSHRAVP